MEFLLYRALFVFLAQQHSVGDLVFRNRFLHAPRSLRAARPLAGNSDHFQTALPVLRLQLFDVRNGSHARHAPGSPEIEKNELSAMLVERPGAAVWIIKGEIL